MITSGEGRSCACMYLCVCLKQYFYWIKVEQIQATAVSRPFIIFHRQDRSRVKKRERGIERGAESESTALWIMERVWCGPRAQRITFTLQHLINGFYRIFFYISFSLAPHVVCGTLRKGYYQSRRYIPTGYQQTSPVPSPLNSFFNSVL